MNAEAGLALAWTQMLNLPQQAGLTERCIELDDRSRDGFPLASLWADLVANRATIVDCFYSASRCFVIVKPTGAVRPDRRLLARKVRVLERILLGEGQKAVALALRVAPSTVTLMSGECLRAMGLDCRTSRVPMALVMAVHAHQTCTDYTDGRISELWWEGTSLRVISAPRPDARLDDLLSPAECAVARLLIEGKRHVEIAEARETSTRTIANQLAAAFHKLGVSGRAELLCRLIRRREVERGRPLVAVPLFPMPSRGFGMRGASGRRPRSEAVLVSDDYETPSQRAAGLA